MTPLTAAAAALAAAVAAAAAAAVLARRQWVPLLRHPLLHLHLQTQHNAMDRTCDQSRHRNNAARFTAAVTPPPP